LEKNTEIFNNFFGEDILNNEWKKIVDSFKPREVKIKELEGFILGVAINNFMWTAKRNVDMLRNWMQILVEVISK
jgi:hypothetical protein